jgi:hypothetical protein
MAEEIKTVKAKVYKLAKGAALELPKLKGVVLTNETLKNPKVIELVMLKHPEVFGTQIVYA